MALRWAAALALLGACGAAQVHYEIMPPVEYHVALETAGDRPVIVAFLDETLKESVETKIKAVEEVLASDDVDMIRGASEALMQSVQELTSKAYEKASKEQTAQAGGADAGAEGGEAKKDDGSVDADYEVVDD